MNWPEQIGFFAGQAATVNLVQPCSSRLEVALTTGAVTAITQISGELTARFPGISIASSDVGIPVSWAAP